MSTLSGRIPKDPVLKPAEDYYLLRREGIGFIEQMGRAHWTDYNTHDPGITILESLCFAITDVAYRIGWPMADLLMPKTPSSDPKQPYPDQAFFTARTILTINPVTPDDYRRLLIDLDSVRNAWLFCWTCACDAYHYAWCENNQMQLAYQAPANKPAQTVVSKGLSDVLLELESNPVLGDLNDRKLSLTYNVFDADGEAHTVLLELRFPDWGLAHPGEWQNFLDADNAFSSTDGESFSVSSAFGATPDYDVLTDSNLDEQGRDAYLRNHWRNLWTVRFTIQLMPSLDTLSIIGATLRFFGDTEAKNRSTAAGIRTILEDISANGFIQRHRSKSVLTKDAVNAAKAALHSHRNLDEDYCRVKVVDIEDVTVCADIEVAADADIERVQAHIWLAIDDYLNPPVPFYSLQERMADGAAVEDIFNGPELNNGFIKQEDLDAADLRQVLRTSDVVNILMDIDGVVAVNNLLLSKYDAMGTLAKGSADPTWTADGKPLFDADKISAAGLLYITPLHQPRFHRPLSRFLFYKNGLPFRPRQNETHDAWLQLKGEVERPKIGNANLDLPTPQGQFRDPGAYFTLQHGFPLNYGIGLDGLPAHATIERRAQAQQLKAYLLAFEQLLANAQAQVAHTADLFSLDSALAHSYFIKLFNDDVIAGFGSLHNGLTEDQLQAIAETASEFYARRNRFLNHVMARFGENFNDYALLLTNAEGVQAANQRLLEDKIAFIRAYPTISHDRGKAFDYTQPPGQNNQSGLKMRLSLVLGFPHLSFDFTTDGPAGGPYSIDYRLLDAHGMPLFSGTLTVSAASGETAERHALQTLLKQLSRPEAYPPLPNEGPFRLTVADEANDLLGQSNDFVEKSAAADFQRELIGWAAHVRGIVVEHLLLRPKFPGDALYPACSEEGCNTCGDEDPYSFRLTWILPGWTAPYNTNLEMRAFAERTMQQELPSHLLGKLCWVDNSGINSIAFDALEAAWLAWLEANAAIDWTEERLKEHLEALLSANLEKPAPATFCDCADDILSAYGQGFYEWLKSNFEAGNGLENLTEFVPIAIQLRETGNDREPSFCSEWSFKPGTGSVLQAFLDGRYATYPVVSYRLWQLVTLLANLSNTYPEATLHDCDDGSDTNPVRLGQTALGALPLDDEPPPNS